MRRTPRSSWRASADDDPSTALVAGLSLRHSGIGVVGPIATGLPTPTIPGVRASDVAPLMIPAAGIAIVAFCDTVLTARSLRRARGRRSTRTRTCVRLV
ncbi:MAG TPA: SulP family inorganic anion transporter [Mycobacterium sp.]|nr:SulP family inorganic anion transporter [Mycobacterium sp.]